MAEINVTTAASFIPTLWAKETIKARTASYVMVPRIMNRTADVKYGDTLRVPLISNLSAGDLGEDGSYTPQAITETYATLSINKRKYSAIQITDEVEVKSQYDLRKEYAPKMGSALAQIMEDDILALYSSITTSTTAQSDIDEALILYAIKTLDNSNVPDSDRHAILCPTQYNHLLEISAYARADYLGTGKSPVLTGRLLDYYGIEWLKSTRVPTSTTRRNLMWHKGAFAIGISKKVDVVKKDVSGAVANDYVGYEFYGVSCERADHGVVLVTSNT